MATANDELMGHTKISRAVATMAVPSVISSLVTIVYNMADTFFVGQTGDSLQVAAVSLTNPIFIFLMAVASMLGMGGSAVASNALGRENEQRAKNVSAFVAYGSLAAGVFLTLILIVFMHPMVSVVGSTEERYLFANGYVTQISYGAPFIIWSAASGMLLRVEGASKEAMIGNMIGTVANIVLDPILISGFGMGVAGAALATTLGNMLASLYYLHFYLKRAKILSIHPKYFTCRNGIMSRTCAIGCSSAIFSALMSVSTIIINQILVAYGSAPVAAIGIVFKANMFITFLQMGVANGVQPLFGYNYGARNYTRYRGIERFTKICCIIIGVLSVILFFSCREPIIRLFIKDEEVIGYGVRMLTAYMLTGPVIGILFVNMNCLQAVGHALPATILSVLRQGLLLIPLLYLLNALLGLNGVIYGQTITDFIAIVLSILMWHRIKKRCLTKNERNSHAEPQTSRTDSRNRSL